MDTRTQPTLRMGTPAARWVIATSVMGSGVALIDQTIVNAALPGLGREFGAGLADLQWIVSGYLLTLSSLLVIGGAFGDRFGRRRVFVVGLVAFGVASAVCGMAPTVLTLILARLVQGAAAALLVPNSLALVSASFAPDDRGAAIGAWSGLGGIAGLIGPFLGGWIIGSVSWRAAFLINIPVCAVAVWLAIRHVPESFDPETERGIDWPGGLCLIVTLAAAVYALIEGPRSNWPPLTVAAVAASVVALVLFVLAELRARSPMVPLELFRSRQFSGANGTTLFVYAALGATQFLVVVHLQTDLGYSPLAAGAAFLPITILMLLFSARAGALAQRIGPRGPMTVGPLIVALSMVLFTRAQPGASFWSGVLPATLTLGVGLTITVAPLTATVLAAVEDRHAGVGSAINNAVARLGALIAVAVVPAAAGLTTSSAALGLDDGFARAMMICAALAASGAVIAALTISRSAEVRDVPRADPATSCLDPCLRHDHVRHAARA